MNQRLPESLARQILATIASPGCEQADAQTRAGRDQREFAPSRFAALRRALKADPVRYARTRNHLDGAVTALSPYLTHGLVSEAEIAALWQSRFDLTLDDKLLMELAWRAFFHDVWRRHGDRILSDMHAPVLPGIDYRREMPSDILLARTGLPVIDKTVTRLYAHGYLHNHQRMWLASYCVHIRKIHWRVGADWLYGHLLDGDLASNHLSWQWVASTFSTKPYLFNDANVSRFAPDLSSPGTLLDRSYEDLARLAATPEPANGTYGHRAQPPAIDVPRLVARTQRFLPPVDFERLSRGQRVALVHPWSLGPRPQADKVIGVFHMPFHARFPWSAKRWDFVVRRMSRLCDAIWTGDLAQFAPVLARAATVSASATLNPGYATALASLPLSLERTPGFLPPAPERVDSFSAYLRHLRRSRPELFRDPQSPPRRLHAAEPRGIDPGAGSLSQAIRHEPIRP